MPVKLGARAEHGFDQPLGLLSDCHRRIERFLGILRKVAEEARGTALSDEQRRAIETALTYFGSAAPRHTQDEEDSLFPLLRASEDPAAKAALAEIEALESDHQKAQAAHDEIDQCFRAWLDRGALPRADAQRLSAVLVELEGLYRRHIEVEDHRIFPLAAKLLNAQQLERLGCEMAGRRGLKAPAGSNPIRP